MAMFATLHVVHLADETYPVRVSASKVSSISKGVSGTFVRMDCGTLYTVKETPEEAAALVEAAILDFMAKTANASVEACQRAAQD
jgi:hypothetical protein